MPANSLALMHAESAALPPGKPPSCHITTHVLDTSRGRPAADVAVVLHRRAPGSVDAGDVWDEVARGATNTDGRIGNWLAPSATVDAGVYRWGCPFVGCPSFSLTGFSALAPICLCRQCVRLWVCMSVCVC